MRSRLAAVGILLTCGPLPLARGGAVVLANRSARDVTFTAAGTAARTVAPYDQVVLYTDGAVTVSLGGGRAYRVEPDAAYFFADAPGGVTLQGIGAVAAPDRPAADGSVLEPPPLETIPVRVFVDEEEPAAQAVWEARLRKRIAAASAVLERTCRVRLVVAGAGTWESDNSAADLAALLSDFERKVPVSGARIMVGFTSQRTPEGVGSMHLGGTRLPLHPYVLLREWSPNTEPGRLEVLLHELGHFLGAVHSPEPVSVMRPKLGDGRAASLRFPVGYDPLNALAMNLVARELRARRVRSLRELTPPTRERLARVYREVQTALPDDPAAGKFLALLTPPPQPPPPPADPAAVRRGDELIEAARTVVEAVVKAAEKNGRLPARDAVGTAPPFRRSGDELTGYYVREAAAAARGLPPDRSARAFLVGLAVALDTADLFRKNPVTGALWRRVESDEEREGRLKVLGQPTVHARHDSCQHFVDSAALVALFGTEKAEAAGVLKELLDSRAGGSGFSFADLASDLSGVEFGRRVLAEPDRLGRLAEGFAPADYAVPPDGLVEGLSAREFTRRFGSTSDKRFTDEMDKLRKRVRELRAYAPPAPPAPAAPPPHPPAGKGVTEEGVPKKPAERGPEELPPPEKLFAPEKILPKVSAPPVIPPEKGTPEKPAPEKPPSQGAPPEPAAAAAPAADESWNVPGSALALAGLGITSLAGSAVAVWPRRPVAGKREVVWAPVVAGTVLALAGFGCLGGAYARWSAPDAEPGSAAVVVASDLEPPWTEPPSDPFEVPVLRAVKIPAFPGARAVWGATGRDGKGHVWFGVSAQGVPEPSARLMEYDPDADRVTERGDVLGELRRSGLLKPGERQGAIRSRIALAADGCLYFASTDDEGAGSHLWRLRPPDGSWEHLLAAPEGLVAVACGGPYVYALGRPGNVLYQYDRAAGGVRSARVGPAEGFSSRHVLADHRGHAYVPRPRQLPSGPGLVLAEFDGGLREVTQTPLDPATLPAADGLTAVQPLADRTLVFAAGRGSLYRVTPGNGDGVAKVAALGAFHPRGEADAAALFSPDGRRYLTGLTRFPARRDGRYQWIVFGLESARPVVVPLPHPAEDGRPLQDLLLFGSMTRDDAGGCYLAGTGRRDGADRPVLLQVRPPR